MMAIKPVVEERKRKSYNLVNEIRTKVILHWNYRSYEEIPMELLEFGRHVQEVYFKENGLQELPEELSFKCPNIRNLYLYSNELTKIPSTIGQMKNLTLLDLSRNKLTELPEEIGSARSLKTLDLSSNQLKSLPRSIGSLEHLEYLYLNANLLKKLPTDLRYCRKLTGLYAGLNRLQSVPETLAECTNLREVYLQENHLKYIPESFTVHLWRLEFLNVSSNDLEYLPSRTFKSVSPRIIFHDNPRLHHISYILACQINMSFLPSNASSTSTSAWRFVSRGCFRPSATAKGIESDPNVIQFTSEDGPIWNLKFSKNLRILKRKNRIPRLLELSLRASYSVLNPREKRKVTLLAPNYKAYSVFHSFFSPSVNLPKSLLEKLNFWRCLCATCCCPLFEEMTLSLLKTTFRAEFERPDESGYCSVHFCSDPCKEKFTESLTDETFYEI